MSVENGEYEEGDDCPEECGGKLEIVRGENCSCHLHPPCNACLEDCFKCDTCGHRPGVER